MDKHHPLEAYFYRWETSEAEIEKIVAEAGKPKKELEDKYRILKKQLGDGTISPPAIRAIIDLTGLKTTNTLMEKSKKLLEGKPESREDIDVLYSYLNVLDLGEGLLFCPKCSRWYPIGSAVESIPELMPDELREEGKDLEWLKKWRATVPEKIMKKGRPFKLG